jgi:hypothetical protein
MPADPATINRANTIMSTGNYAAKLALLRELPICPPSNYQAGGAHAFAPTLKSPLGALDNRVTKYLTKKKLTVSDRVAFIKFKARTDASGEPGSIEFELKYAEDLPSDASRVGYIPVWFSAMGVGLHVEAEDRVCGRQSDVKSRCGNDCYRQSGRVFHGRD